MRSRLQAVLDACASLCSRVAQQVSPLSAECDLYFFRQPSTSAAHTSETTRACIVAKFDGWRSADSRRHRTRVHSSTPNSVSPSDRRSSSWQRHLLRRLLDPRLLESSYAHRPVQSVPMATRAVSRCSASPAGCAQSAQNFYAHVKVDTLGPRRPSSTLASSLGQRPDELYVV